MGSTLFCYTQGGIYTDRRAAYGTLKIFAFEGNENSPMEGVFVEIESENLSGYTDSEGFLLFTGALILLGWGPVTDKSIVRRGTTVVPTISEYSLMILFTSMGATIIDIDGNIIAEYSRAPFMNDYSVTINDNDKM